MKNRTVKWFPFVMALVLLMLPLFEAIAESTESLHFEGPFACERMTIDSVTIHNSGAEMLVDILYTLHEDLDDTDKEALEIMSFYIMPDLESTEFPDGFRSGSMGAVDKSIGATVVAGQQYSQNDTWEGRESLPETIILRPFYKFIGEWGAPVELVTEDAK